MTFLAFRSNVHLNKNTNFILGVLVEKMMCYMAGAQISFARIQLYMVLKKQLVGILQGSTLAVFRYPEHPRFSDGIPDWPAQ